MIGTTSHVRTRNILRHVGQSFFLRVGSVTANFTIVPLALAYLGAPGFGVWLTISSALPWLSVLDLGLGNGLRNKFAESRAHGRDEEARAYVSTAYLVVSGVAVLVFASALLLGPFLNWTAIFNAPPIMSDELTLLLPLVFSFFALQLVVRLIVSVYQADQHHSIQDRIQFLSQLLSLLLVWLLTQTESSSVLYFGLLYTASPLLILLLFNAVAFNGRFARYRPSVFLSSREHLTEIWGLGLKFFVIQMAAIVLLSTDNFVIVHIFGPAEVVSYNIAFKYVSVVIMGYSLLVAPFWSSFTEAHSKGDTGWIEASVSAVQRAWLLIPPILLAMILLAEWFYSVWVGDEVQVAASLTLSMALYAAIWTFNSIYVQFINGVGKVGLQFRVSVAVLLGNIPLSIVFARGLGIGSAGVVLATCVCLLIPAVLWVIQYHRLINGTARGIWNA